MNEEDIPEGVVAVPVIDDLADILSPIPTVLITIWSLKNVASKDGGTFARLVLLLVVSPSSTNVGGSHYAKRVIPHRR